MKIRIVSMMAALILALSVFGANVAPSQAHGVPPLADVDYHSCIGSTIVTGEAVTDNAEGSVYDTDGNEGYSYTHSTLDLPGWDTNGNYYSINLYVAVEHYPTYIKQIEYVSIIGSNLIYYSNEIQSMDPYTGTLLHYSNIDGCVPNEYGK